MPRSYASLRPCHKTSPIGYGAREFLGEIDERPRNTGTPPARPQRAGGIGDRARLHVPLPGTYGTSDDVQAIPFLERAIELGVDFLDSSDAYGLGQNEEVLGRALASLPKGRRDNIVVATKFGQDRRSGGVNGRPEYVQQACEASLKRLGVDVIDLYYQHRVDPDVPVEDTVGAMSRLVEQGKVRFLGLCEARPERIRRAHAVHPIAAVQSEFSLLYREVADETRVTTREAGIAFVPYSPLGRSLLARVIPDFTGNLSEGDTTAPPPALRGR